MALTKRQIQAKLNRIAKLASELDDEAKRRWGPDAMLFFEAEGAFFMMSGDSDRSSLTRQQFIQMRSEGYCRMGAGAW